MINFNIVPLNKELEGAIGLNIPGVNADWEATTGLAEILNKPNIPSTAADITIIDSQDRFTSITIEDALAEICRLKIKIY